MPENRDKNSLKFIAYVLLLAMIVNSIYLSYKYIKFYYFADFTQSFDCVEDCDSVMMSSYSMLFGIPVPVYGLVYFVFITLYFSLKDRFKLPVLVLDASVAMGCLAAAWFLHVLYYRLEMFCKFCLFSHACLLTFALFYFLLLRSSKPKVD